MIEAPPIKSPERKLTWKTKDGRTLDPREMTTGHVVNALRFLKRRLRFKKREEYNDNLASLYGGMSGMSDAAQDAMSWEAQTLEVEHWTHKAPPIVAAFVQVLRDRACPDLAGILEP